MTELLSNTEKILLGVTVPGYAVIIFLEMALSNYAGKKIYSLRDSFTNLYLTILNMLIDLAMRGTTIVAMAWAFQFHFVNALHLKTTTPWLYWTLLVIGWEFMFYWIHRTEHASRIFWAVHATHHSSEYYNFSVGFRSSVFEPVYRFLFYLPLALVGFNPLDCFLVFSCTQIYGLLVHTQYIQRIPIYEWFFVTPAHHRVHHACNVRYLDKNMGMFLIVWDRIFGTFAGEVPEEKPEYGLLKKNTDLSVPFNVVFHEWKTIWKDISRKDISFSAKLNYLFNAPGWSHDGSRKTTKQLRDELN